MSSRNAYLSADERAVAPTLYRVLQECAAQHQAGKPIATLWAKAKRRSSARAFRSIILRRATPRRWRQIASIADGPVRLLVAAKLGRTRLIDNIAV